VLISTVVMQGLGDGTLVVTQGYGTPRYAATSLRAAIHARLVALAGVVAIVGPRVYPDHPPQSWSYTDGPSLSHQVIAHTFDLDLDGAVLSGEALVQFTARSLAKLDGLAVLEVLRRQLVGTSADWSGVKVDYVAWSGKRCHPALIGDGSDAQLYIASIDCTIGHQPGA
jgi:hypothetical protein